MRFLLLGAAALLPQASVAAPSADGSNVVSAPGPRQLGVKPAAECRRAKDYTAQSGTDWRGEGLTPKNLTELRPATAYMAVERVVDGCEVPMTVVEYRRFGG